MIQIKCLFETIEDNGDGEDGRNGGGGDTKKVGWNLEGRCQVLGGSTSLAGADSETSPATAISP